MRIDSSKIGMDSVRTYSTQTMRRNSFSFGSKTKEDTVSKQWTGENTEEDTKDVFSGTGGSFDDFYGGFQNKLSTVGISRASANRNTKAMIGTIKQECLNYIFMLLFGEKKKTDYSNMADVLVADTADITSKFSSMYLNESREFFYMEKEQTSFSTTGSVVTADGRQIDFGLEFEMSRSFAEYYYAERSVEQVQLCDPLVINLDGNLTEISDQKFMFDLDQDGVLDEISKCGSGSGFLALDRNGDGVINDGGELFGTKSGDGFGDLSLYDEDGNGWIDENDEIFDKLLIWMKDEDGNDKLYHLKETGVGAICLKHVSTEFALKNANQETNGYLRNSGVFLFEDGNVGTIAHVDFAT